jgi:hypothetical protein
MLVRLERRADQTKPRCENLASIIPARDRTPPNPSARSAASTAGGSR